MEEEEFEQESSKRSDVFHGVKRSIGAVIALVFAVLLVLGFLGLAGPLGSGLDWSIGLIFGWGKWITPLIALLISVFLLGKKPEGWSDILRFAGLGIAFISLLGLVHFFSTSAETALTLAEQGVGGGLLGFGLIFVATKVAGSVGGVVLLVMFFVVGCIASFNVSLIQWKERWQASRQHSIDEQEFLEEDVQEFIDDDPESLEISDETVSRKRSLLKRIPFFGGEPSEDGLSAWETVEEQSAISNEQAPMTMTHQENIDLEQSNIASFRFADGYHSPADLSIGASSSEPASANKTNGTGELFPIKEEILIPKQHKRPRQWKFPPHYLTERHLLPQERAGGKDENARIIQETLKHFGIEVEFGSAQPGPTVTQYTFRPASGIKLSRITALHDDLSLALSAPSIRIEAPIPGKALLGVEVPNNSPAEVRFRNLLESREVASRKGESLLVILGKDVSGGAVVTNLEKLPHLLIAGATNSGKSVCINTLLLSLLYRNTPDDLQLILVDPKRVELTPYNKIPHLKTPVIVEPKKVVSVLKWATGEMERRYKILEESKSRDIHSYRAKRQAGEIYQSIDPMTNKVSEQVLESMPFIVIVIDEMADLMMAHGKDVEGLIVRLAQMSRAVGIHLILATQRPSVEVITGLIKANITARIAFQVATQIDSRTILDMGGAEKLLGRGDMLFIAPTAPQPKRIQGVFVSEEEVHRVTDFWREQNRDDDEGIPESMETTSQDTDEGDSRSANVLRDPMSPDVLDLDQPEIDERYEEAKQIVIETGKASASFLQRRMSVGYSRAARILDELEAGGIIGPSDGAKARAIYVGKGAKNQDMVGYEDTSDDQQAREKWVM